MLLGFSTLRLHAIPEGVRFWFYTFLALLPGLWLLLHGQFNLLTALIILLSILTVSITKKSIAICLTFIFLFLLGDVRRFIGSLVGMPKLDMLLLVGPVVSAFFAAPILLKLRLSDSISKVTFALMIVMTLEIINPRQGNIIVGFSGALFYLVPVLWFWVGREYGTDSLLHALIYKVVIPLGVLSAVLGLFQMFVGFLPWEQSWINAVIGHYHALNLGGGAVRAFGFSVNSIEYADLLLIAATCSAAAAFAGKRSYALLLPLLLTALFLESSRGPIVKLLFALSAAWAISNKGGRGWVFRMIAALIVGVGLIAFSLSHVGGGSSSGQSSALQLSTQHQLNGLAHPLDSKRSTAGLHAKMFTDGIMQGFKYPIGKGLGSTTLGSGKFGGDEDSGSSEIDISDTFITMGAVGGLLFLATIFLVLKRAVTYGRFAPRSLGLPLLGTLAAMGGAWLAMGQYAIAPLVWFLIGSLSRSKLNASPVTLRAPQVTPLLRRVPSSHVQSPI